MPIHRASLSLQQQLRKIFWLVGMAYEGANNDLSQPPFATVQASASYDLGHTTLSLAAANLTGVYAGKFTLVGAGVPYAGLAGPIATDAYQLQAPSLTVSLSQHW